MQNHIDVKYVAKLARLEISEEHAQKLQRDLENIVGYIDELSQVDVTGVEPTAHASNLSNVWRADVAGTPFDRDVMLANAPGVVHGETVKVPQVLPGEGMS